MSDSPLTIKVFVDSMFAENAYVVSAAGEAGFRVGWVIDPGLGRQVDQILRHVSDLHITVEKIVLTHGHADHLAGVDAVHDAHPAAGVVIGAGDRGMMSDPWENLSAQFGFEVILKTPPDGDLEPGTEILLADTRWQVLDTSGHSPGGRSLYCPEAGVVFTGDALFADSIGRTDFPGSDHARLIENIRKALFVLPPETVVHSGHGPTTTIGNERKSNPFVSDA
ncbi:MAG TPA: MBL fold metallo-hydrolase [Phycisphaerae bacterium]|nr:MBL fold metallo-hydrolase [Phycisphaerae bacterium]